MNSQLLINNIIFWADKMNKKPTTLCSESGAGKDFISNIKKGQTPSVAKVQMLADYIGISTSELLGEKIQPATREGDELDEQTARLVDKLRQMAPEDQELLEAQIDVMLRRRQEK